MVCFVDDPSQKWELDVSPSMGDIVIRATKGCMELRPGWTVSPPNIIERLLGISFERKVEKTKAKAQKRIDKLNVEIERANKIAGIKPFDVSRPPISRPVKIEEGE